LEQIGALPLLADADQYDSSGFYICNRVVPEVVLDRAELGMERFYRGERDWPFPPLVYIYDDKSHEIWDRAHGWNPSRGQSLRKNDYASLQVRELAELVRYPVIGQIASILTRSPVIRLWHDQLIYKPPEANDQMARVGWHTDRQYWSTCTSADMLTAWVPFHDVDMEFGSISFLEGSHRWSESVANKVTLDFYSGDLSSQLAHLVATGASVKTTEVSLKRGQITFHHCRTIHGSGPNRTEQSRRSLSIHLQPGDNRYQPPPAQDAFHKNDLDLICRHVGDQADYTDARIFPVLWNE
jgi:Phytanoyl-CoA dioxygenase (PhyH)